MKLPNIKVKVVHSQTKSAWNIIGETLGGKYKIARVPYIPISLDGSYDRERTEAHEHAEFIAYCFNNSEAINDYTKTKRKK